MAICHKLILEPGVFHQRALCGRTRWKLITPIAEWVTCRVCLRILALR